MHRLRYRMKSKEAFKPEVGAVGYDLRAPADFVIKARDSCCVDLRLSLRLDGGGVGHDQYYFEFVPRAELAHKYQIVPTATTVKSDKVLCVTLLNHGKKSRQFKRGDKIVAVVIKRDYRPATLLEDADDVKGIC
uniref:dUTPase n=1 Tax=Ophiusa disjungens nucleopolyhedrovirus TaxID=521523 RepID=B6E2B8_9ABAC|nr:dUTPase [Ophiusa disjungens nucleopolyhedrovirus]